MPSRRDVLCSVAAVGVATVPGSAAASTDRPTADVDAALRAFGSGAVDGRIAPRVVPRIGEAASTVSAEAPAVADAAADRLPTAPTAVASDGRVLGALADADLHAATVTPAIDGVDRLAVGVDFAARGPVVRARVTGVDGAPTRAAALDALTYAGLPVAALEPFAVPDGDDLALYAGLADRDDGQPIVLALLVVVLAAVVGTFVLGLGSSVSGGRSGGVSRTAPNVSFGYEYDAGSGRVTVRHEGGDTVDAGELQVAYRSDGSIEVETWGGDAPVAAGDTFTTGQSVDSGATLRIVWYSDDGDTSATLGSFEVP